MRFSARTRSEVVGKVLAPHKVRARFSRPELCLGYGLQWQG